MAFFVYILECGDGSLYTGITTNLNKRLSEHSMGKGSKYVRSRLPARILHSEEFETRSEALKRENQIKRLTRKQKRMLVSGP